MTGIVSFRLWCLGLSEFRSRLVDGGTEEQLLEMLLVFCREWHPLGARPPFTRESSTSSKPIGLFDPQNAVRRSCAATDRSTCGRADD